MSTRQVSGEVWTCDAKACTSNFFLPEDGSPAPIPGFYGTALHEEQPGSPVGGKWYACTGGHILQAIQEVIRRDREHEQP